ncbi:unnamed protein product [Caenorhabditis angaria]|uniref:Glycosyltransferase family 92 protein n=1 Tax=Caenorhabditis angaria TaxID=860376 RepID=A0A9P1IQ30_9PELO|nr:unnamed protein product [Caenorhabditis angaria]
MRFRIIKVQRKISVIFILITLLILRQIFSILLRNYYDSDSETFQCYIDKWNRKNTYEIPNSEFHEKWAQENLTYARMDNIFGAQLRLVNSFVYEDYIAVTTTVQHSEYDNITCVYFDCNREEIPNSRFLSKYLPYNIVFCPRRYGAKYISLDLEDGNSEMPEPIPMIYRIYKKPVHEVSVCVGPIYGNESKWLGIAEYIEHYKLIGVKHFYFTVFDINEYDRKILNDYIRLGEIEVTQLDTEYKKEDWQFHMIQINECHMRARFHSKWVINVDFDERLILKNNNTIQDVLNFDKTAIELRLALERVLKNESMPEKYISNFQTIRDMQFIKHNLTSKISQYNEKIIYRPDKAAHVFYHYVMRRYTDQEYMTKIDPEIAYLRHYRTDAKGINSGWEKEYDEFRETALEEEFSRKLVKNILKRVEYVYNERQLFCDEIAPKYFNTYSKFSKDVFNCVDRQ